MIVAHAYRDGNLHLEVTNAPPPTPPHLTTLLTYTTLSWRNPRQVLELAGAAADVVVCLAGEPGAAGGEIGPCARCAGLPGTRLDRGGQSAGLPPGEQGLEPRGGAAEASPGQQEKRSPGGVAIHMRRQCRAHPEQDG